MNHRRSRASYYKPAPLSQERVSSMLDNLTMRLDRMYEQGDLPHRSVYSQSRCGSDFMLVNNSGDILDICPRLTIRFGTSFKGGVLGRKLHDIMDIPEGAWKQVICGCEVSFTIEHNNIALVIYAAPGSKIKRNNFLMNIVGGGVFITVLRPKNLHFHSYLQGTLKDDIEASRSLIPWDDEGLNKNRVLTDTTENHKCSYKIHKCWNLKYCARQFKSRKWSVEFITRITPSNLILDNIDCPWSSTVLSLRKDIKKLMNCGLIDAQKVSLNANITLSDIDNNPHISWNKSLFNMNPGMIKHILDGKYEPNFYLLSNNDSVTVDMIKNNIKSDWSWFGVSRCVSPNIEVASRKWMCAYKLQNSLYNKVAYDPSYKFCRKLLVRMHRIACEDTLMLIN